MSRTSRFERVDMDWEWRTTDGQTGRMTSGQKRTVADAPDGDQSQLKDLIAGADIDDQWAAEIVVTFEGGEALLSELRFRPLAGPVSAVDAKTLARFRLSAMQRELADQLPLVLSLLPLSGVESPTYVPPTPGRGGYSDAQYALWARDYVEALAEEPGRPVALLAERNPRIDASAWRRRLDGAAKRGLLVGRPAGNKGRAGGRLSAKAKRLLSIPKAVQS